LKPLLNFKCPVQNPTFQVGPALALQLASLLEKVQPERGDCCAALLCSALVSAATARLLRVMGMDQVTGPRAFF
jgi:hypothetical protein